MDFGNNNDPDRFDFRAHPEAYRIGKGEEGVFRFEPYRTELLPLVAYQNSALALRSASTLYEKFLSYLKDNDFPGADMARKYLLFGFNRTLRLAVNKAVAQLEPEAGIDASTIFYEYYEKALSHPKYKRLKAKHIALYS